MTKEIDIIRIKTTYPMVQKTIAIVGVSFAMLPKIQEHPSLNLLHAPHAIYTTRSRKARIHTATCEERGIDENPSLSF